MTNKKVTRFVMMGCVVAAFFLGTGLGTAHGEGTVDDKTLETIQKADKLLMRAGAYTKVGKVVYDVGKKSYEYSKGEATGGDVYVTACRSITSVSTGYMGAVAGAETGAAIGLFVGGPVGAGIGGIVGGIIGGFGGAFVGEKGIDCLEKLSE